MPSRVIALSQAPNVAQRPKPPRPFNHLVGEGEQLVGHGEAEGLGGGQVEDEVELDRLLDREVARLRPAQNLVDILGGAAKQAREVGERALM